MLSGTSATSAMPPHVAQTAPRRQMEPLADQAAAATGRGRPPAAAPPPRERSGGGMRLFVALSSCSRSPPPASPATRRSNGSGTKSVQLREDVGGKAQQAIDELRGLIEDNTQ